MWKGPATRREVSLTLDDGPDPYYTPQLLDCLAAHDVKATFFLVGERAAAHRHLVQQIVDRGHEVGSHSYSHPDFLRLSWKSALQELDATRQTLSAWSRAAMPRLFRPPHGALCSSSTVVPWSRGERVVLWSVDLKDYLADEITDITARAARTRIGPGDIILYHGHNAASLGALPEVLRQVRKNGLAFVPVSKMLRA
jgi:peptidoglycan/xylan/chitin deacetylase (PgdA/CDA1 family)